MTNNYPWKTAIFYSNVLQKIDCLMEWKTINKTKSFKMMILRRIRIDTNTDFKNKKIKHTLLICPLLWPIGEGVFFYIKTFLLYPPNALYGSNTVKNGFRVVFPFFIQTAVYRPFISVSGNINFI